MERDEVLPIAGNLIAHLQQRDVDWKVVEPMVVILKKIAYAPEGPFSLDKETYLKNVIEWCKSAAESVLPEAVREPS